MSEYETHVKPLYDRDGNLHGVLLSPEIWEKAGKKISEILDQAQDKQPTSEIHQEPIEDWETFKDYWDFKYPFNPGVTCNACGAKSENWEEDTPRVFYLKNASLSGLLVFHCEKCGSTVRKKHFKDHVCLEATKPSGESCEPECIYPE
ncbi:hypothetical protein ACQ0P8_12025 [Halodesulfovibrio aestuarii]|uniref:Uncharacterized protein n=1 Tax=Halodesulfovibrio aestuarii TaxID=126333 RepID=A0A8G2F917_9BACT|nr:hypothetical protein [Halodesulfovibrio aestuarii]SHJ69607.1 hypothetical protein SAMN05660830_03020 [Halodesulfovibrio aestuarii]